jgi:hypothetical protein
MTARILLSDFRRLPCQQWLQTFSYLGRSFWAIRRCDSSNSCVGVNLALDAVGLLVVTTAVIELELSSVSVLVSTGSFAFAFASIRWCGCFSFLVFDE